MKTKELFEATLMLSIGAYFLYTFSMALYFGELTILKSGKTITLANEPFRFWVVAGIQGIIGFLIIYILYFKIQNFISNSKARKKNSSCRKVFGGSTSFHQ